MTKNSEHIDEIFKQGLGDIRMEPPADMFNAVNKEFIQGNDAFSSGAAKTVTKTALKSVKGLWIWGAAISVVAVTAVMTSIDRNDEPKPQYLEKAENISESKPTVPPIIEKQPEVVQEAPTEESNPGIHIEEDRDVIVPTDEVNSNTIHDELNVASQIVVNPILPSEPEKQVAKVKGEAEEIIRRKNKSCENRFQLETDESYNGTSQLSFAISGPLAQYKTWIHGDEQELFVGKKTRINRPFNVKKTTAVKIVVVARFMDNCRDTQTMVQIIKPSISESEIMLPTVFTPNGDGQNDSFYLKISEPKKFRLWIVNTRGELMFETEDVYEKWPGTRFGQPCEAGAYRVNYQLIYEDQPQEKVESYLLWLKR